MIVDISKWFFLSRTLLGTFIISITGALLAWLIHIPAPFILGPAVLCTISALLGFNIKVPNFLRNICFATIGLNLGSNINPKSFSMILQWPLSLIFMCISITITVLLGSFFLKSWMKIDYRSAVLSASPGLLTYIVSLSLDTNSNTPVISVIQSIRVLMLTIAIPFTIMFATEITSEILFLQVKTIPLKALLFLYFSALFFGSLLKKFKVPAAFLISGLICSTVSHAINITPGEVPYLISTTAFIILGSLIGSRFTNVSMKILKSCLFSGLILTALGFMISLTAAFLVKSLTGIKFLDLIIAFAPGGLETMLAMGAIVNSDPTFLAAHHMLRLFFLGGLIPTMISICNKVNNLK